jgi:hypothetical protein
MLDRMYPTTANSTGRWQRAGYGSLAPEIVSRMDSMRANLVGSKRRELRMFEAKWQHHRSKMGISDSRVQAESIVEKKKDGECLNFFFSLYFSGIYEDRHSIAVYSFIKRAAVQGHKST